MLQIYSMYTIKEDQYGMPMFFHNEDQAKQAITMFFTKKTMENFDPQEFELVHIGDFNELTGVIRNIEITTISNCSNLVNKELN